MLTQLHKNKIKKEEKSQKSKHTTHTNIASQRITNKKQTHKKQRRGSGRGCARKGQSKSSCHKEYFRIETIKMKECEGRKVRKVVSSMSESWRQVN